MYNISLIGGPGVHGEALLRILVEAHYSVQYFHYSPIFQERYYLNNSLISKTNSLQFQIKDKILAQFFNKLIGSHNNYNEFLWKTYDNEVAKRLLQADVLISWPQVSLQAILKQKERNGKVLIEYPMIHTVEWQYKMKNVYSKLGIGKSINIFSSKLEAKMLNELQLSDKINVLSSYAKKTFINHGVDELKLNIIPPYVNSSHFNIDYEALKSKEFTFLFVGRIDVLKGVHLLLEAFDKAAIKNSKLVLVGHINNEVSFFLKKYRKNVEHYPFQDHEHLLKLYNKSHVLVLPSIQESFGMVLLEAMLCGIPVITSSTTASVDVVSKINGLIFESESVDDLVRSLIQMYNGYSTYSNESIRDSIVNRFSKEVYSLKYMKLLKELSSK